MQRQKTVAKWLAIILLCTVAVGAYIMYDALYVGSNGGGQASASTDEIPDNPHPDDETPEPDDTPFYTTLPREAQTVSGVTVRHAGGEGDEEVLGAVFSADNAMVFFNSSSAEYDCRGAGMYRALFNDGNLTDVTRFSDAGDLADVKLTNEGITALVRVDDGCRLYLFATDGTPKGETAFPSFTQAEIYLAGSTTQVFYTDAQGLRAAVVKQGLSVEVSPYFYSPEALDVKDVYLVGSRYLLFGETSDSDTVILSFEQNRGFNLLKRFEKTSFMQSVPMAGEDGAAFAFLGETSDGGTLAVLATDCSEIARTTLSPLGNAVIFSDGVSLTLVRCGVTETYCRHLDLIASRTNALLFDDLLFVRNSSEGRLFAATRTEGFSVFAEDARGDMTERLFVPATDVSALCATVSAQEVFIAFSTAACGGYCYQNFGGKDAFLLSFPPLAETA